MNPDDSLLVMVHGTPRPSANLTIYQVVEEVRTRGVFARVAIGFMECNEPSIPDAIDSLVAEGALTIRAVPYFLHTGMHVSDDLPTLLEEAQVRHPHITFRMGDFLGRSPLLTDLLAARAEAVR
jgi:sirohydrochlorin cobaltochelatase